MHNNNKATVSELQNRVKFMSDALENTSQPFAAGYPDGRIMACNSAFCDLTGYSREELLNNVSWSAELTPPEWRQIESDALKELNRTGKPKRYEKEYLRKDGTRVPVEIFCHQALDENGNLLYYYSFVTDLRERKHAEEKLKNSEARFRALFEVASDAIFIADVDTGMIVDCNLNAEKLVGRSRNEILGLHQIELHPRGEEDKYRKIFQMHVQQGGIVNYEMEVLHKDGRRIPVLISARSTVLDGKKIIMGYFLDITEHKRLEDRLAHVASFPELNPNPIFEVDECGVITYSNPAANQLFPDLRAMGMSHPMLKGITTEIFKNEKRSEFTREVLINDVTYQQSIYILPDMKLIRIYSRDITESKRVGDALEIAKERAELYLDLMGHDISNIHQAALGYLELARDMPCDSRHEYLDKAAEALNRSSRLIDNVRKLQNFQDDRHLHDVDVCAVLAGVHEEYATTPGKMLTFNLNCHTNCHILADDLLHDVFSNLVGNAVKHTGDRAHIVISLDRVSEDGLDYCRVLVEDDGPGIPDKSKKTLFNRSLKGTPRPKGMGLGLYIVKTLVENYGGRVWVEDRVQGDYTKGAKFMVMLPVAEQ